MHAFQQKPYLAWTLVLALSLSLSIALYFITPPERVRRVLFFPSPGTDTLSGETRYLLYKPDVESEIRTVVEAMVLGPVSVTHLRLIPRQTEIRSILYRNNIAYIDFNTGILFKEREVPLEPEEMLQAIYRSIRFNFPFLKNVIVMVNGQLPDQPYYEIKPVPQKKPGK